MKKSFLRPLMVLCAAGTVFAVSCKKSDDTKSRRDQLPGNYYTFQEGDDVNANGIFDDSEKTTIPAGSQDTLAFKADGTGVNKTSAGLSVPFSWELIDNDANIKIIVPNLDTITAGIISIDDASVTVVDDITQTGTNKSFTTFKRY